MLAAALRTHVGVGLVGEERAPEVEEHRVDHGAVTGRVRPAPREQLVGAASRSRRGRR